MSSSSIVTRRPDTLVVGGGSRLISLEAGASEFGVTPETFRSTVEGWGIPVLTVGDRSFVAIVELEIELVRRTVRWAHDDSSIRSTLEWISRYQGEARRRAVLECVRAYKPSWDTLHKRVNIRGRSKGDYEERRRRRRTSHPDPRGADQGDR
jgi:hypothetical protein